MKDSVSFIPNMGNCDLLHVQLSITLLLVVSLYVMQENAVICVFMLNIVITSWDTAHEIIMLPHESIMLWNDNSFQCWGILGVSNMLIVVQCVKTYYSINTQNDLEDNSVTLLLTSICVKCFSNCKKYNNYL